MDLVDKCLKLWSLARSPSENEAIRAIERLHYLMTLNGITYGDLTAIDHVTERLDPQATLARRSIALAVAVSRGCEITETAAGLFVHGPRAATLDAVKLYTALIALFSRPQFFTPPTHVWRETARLDRELICAIGLQRIGSVASTGVLRLRAVCEEHFNLGVFEAVGARLPPPPSILDSFKAPLNQVAREMMIFAQTITQAVASSFPVTTDEAITRERAELDDATIGLVERLGSPSATSHAAELQSWARGRGRTAALGFAVWQWLPAGRRRAPVKALLPAADPRDIRQRTQAARTQATYASVIDLG